jgi:hypothetical protein
MKLFYKSSSQGFFHRSFSGPPMLVVYPENLQSMHNVPIAGTRRLCSTLPRFSEAGENIFAFRTH